MPLNQQGERGLFYGVSDPDDWGEIRFLLHSGTRKAMSRTQGLSLVPFRTSKFNSKSQCKQSFTITTQGRPTKDSDPT